MFYNIVLVLAIHQHESVIGIHMFPPSEASLPPPTPFHPSRLSQTPGWSSLPQTRRGPTLRSQLCRAPEVGGSESETERKPDFPASPRDEALFHFGNPSGVPRGPANSTASLTSQGHPRSSLRSPAEVEGNEGFLPPLEKGLDSPSSKCLEALIPSLD